MFIENKLTMKCLKTKKSSCFNSQSKNIKQAEYLTIATSRDSDERKQNKKECYSSSESTDDSCSQCDKTNNANSENTVMNNCERSLLDCITLKIKELEDKVSLYEKIIVDLIVKNEDFTSRIEKLEVINLNYINDDWSPIRDSLELIGCSNNIVEHDTLLDINNEEGEISFVPSVVPICDDSN